MGDSYAMVTWFLLWSIDVEVEAVLALVLLQVLEQLLEVVEPAHRHEPGGHHQCLIHT